MSKVLVVVDMIKGFLRERTRDGPCKLYVKGADSIIPNILREIKTADDVIFVCDSHERNDSEFIKWGPHAIRGSEECEIVEELRVRSYYPFEKTRFSGFYQTTLNMAIAHPNPPDELIIAGVFTDICIFATALDACYRNYNVTIIKDCVYPIDANRGDYLLKYLTDMFSNFKVR